MDIKTNAWGVRDAGKISFFLGCSMVALIVWIRSNPYLFINGTSYLSNWNYTHYLFNYDDGFVKRGVVGDFLKTLVGHVSYDFVSFVSYVSLGGLSFLFLLFFSKAYIGHGERFGAFLLMVFAAASPATLQHFAFDVGRFDLIIYMIFILIVLSINFLAERSVYVTFAIVVAGLSLSVLVHEAALFMILPLSLVFWNYIDSSRKGVVLQGLAFVVIFFITFLVSTHGEYSALGFEDHLEALRSIYGDRVVSSSLVVIHHSSLEENVSRTIRLGLSFPRLVHHGALVFFMMPFMYMMYKLYMSMRGQIDLKVKLIFIASLSPLALYPLGQDHFRWWSLTITNIILAICFIVLRDKVVRDGVLSFLEDRVKLVSFVVLFGLVSGPLCVTESFDVVVYTAKFVGSVMPKL
ncbi:hypothetical protein KZO83_05875 [Chromohalobacter sp. TMW 2.2308]|uniref:hypothetical protein n=1 Tax=Chromohalobacter TaxID=42054 RepID=UPI001FFCD7CA|nr:MULTISPECIES: hypothetical protein [Chromohalobacter]MCK2042212.1 hypothetical protein [Chromohalobacter moromii]MCT8514360.1 hypothetical protein [Chromohalobacter sp. TMW 2.2271]